MSFSNTPRKRVIVIGGGYAGTLLAKAIDQTVDVVLIEPREAFFHKVARRASARSAPQPADGHGF
jgi:NADH dehydrogenase FAD-containing subunit